MERGGAVTTKVIKKITTKNLHKFITSNVDPKATLNTDQFVSYGFAKHIQDRHDTVNHSQSEFSATQSRRHGFPCQLVRVVFQPAKTRCVTEPSTISALSIYSVIVMSSPFVGPTGSPATGSAWPHGCGKFQASG